MNDIGQLTKTPSGTITTGLITYPDKDGETESYISEILGSFEEDMNRVVGYSEIDLSIASEDGIRMVRNGRLIWEISVQMPAALSPVRILL